MTAGPTEVAKALYNAYASSDRAAAERLVAKDFHFTSPLDNRLNRETYFEHCWPNNATTASFDFIHVVENGNRVFVTYELTATDGKRFRNTEIVAVRNGQVFEAEVYFGWDLPHKAPTGGFVRSEATS